MCGLSLMALLKGRSDSAELDSIAQSVHMLLFHLKATLWWGWVPSKSNWTDAISREGLRDPWYHKQGFRVHVSTIPCELWLLPLHIKSHIFSFSSSLSAEGYSECIGIRRSIYLRLIRAKDSREQLALRVVPRERGIQSTMGDSS